MEEVIRLLLLLVFTTAFGSIVIALAILVAFVGIDKELQKIASSYEQRNRNKNKNDSREVSENV